MKTPATIVILVSGALATLDAVSRDRCPSASCLRSGITWTGAFAETAAGPGGHQEPAEAEPPARSGR